MSLLQRLEVVLVEPGEGGNVGSCARAMKNLGLSTLRLVRPDFSQREALKMAVHARDLLQGASLHDSIDEAVASAAWVVGTTARRRDNPERKPFLDPDGFVAGLKTLPLEARTAVVFGCERTGLTNGQLGHCRDVLRLPTEAAYPALNLAQAVLLVAWEVRRADLAGSHQPEPIARELTTAADLEGLVRHLERTLALLDFLDPQNPQIVLAELRALFARALLSPRELNMLRGILHQVDVFVAAHGGPPPPNQPRGPGSRKGKGGSPRR